MNGMILQTPTENKDIKLSIKKGEDTKSQEDGNLFENLIATLISEEKDNKNASFLLGKLLNLSHDFKDKGKIFSDFSKGDLSVADEEAALVSLEDLFKVALALKNGENFKTESPALNEALKDKNVISQFKEATNIKELLKIADKNGIKVKNFEFFMPKVALTPKDKKMVQKITSEDIFKMVEPKQTLKEPAPMQNILTKIIKQEFQKDKTVEVEKKTSLTSLLSQNSQHKKESKTEKIIMTKTEERKPESKLKTTNTEKESISDLEQEQIQEHFKTQKHKKAQTNTLATLLKNDTAPKESMKAEPSQISKTEEPLNKTESETKETSIEKHTNTGEIKSEVVHKTKQTHDVKKTFNTFAMEFKEKVEAYKPPMMKVNMQLSPKNLGDVDVTLITRGNHLQVNINSNSQNTIALFVQNQNDFKNSLVNMGFSDLQMNFSDKRGEEKNQQEQKKEEQSSDYHDSLENEEEGINMILPNYV